MTDDMRKLKFKCSFAFEKRKLMDKTEKAALLTTVSDVFAAACGEAYSILAVQCRRLDCRGAEISVTFTDDEGIRTYNREYRDIDRATDVLSFPNLNFKNGKGGAEAADIDPETGLLFLGDMVISLPRARAQAAEYGHSLRRELGFLTAHSALHVLGYDHMEAREAKQMEAFAEQILGGLGITRDAE